MIKMFPMRKKTPLKIKFLFMAFAFPFLLQLTACSPEDAGSGGIRNCDSEATFKLGIQSWTFNKMSLVDALDEVQNLRIRYMQCYPGQVLGDGFEPGEKFHHTMKPESREKILALMKSRGITLSSYGVIKAKNKTEWEQVFEFAKAMGMQDISVEPDYKDWPEVLPLLANLATQHGIGIGIHNHAGPLSPEMQAKRLAAYEDVIKFTPDTGSWTWSGFDPVRGLKCFSGRIQSVHMRDLTGMTHKSHDVPWGTGVGNAAGQLLELRQQGFSGVVYIEYNYHGRDLKGDVALCAEFFRRAATADDEALLSGKILPPGFVEGDRVADIARKQDSGRWKAPRPLFKDDLSDADFEQGSWEMKDGILRPLPGGKGHIWTKEDFSDFVVTGEFLCPVAHANSGILLRCTNTKSYLNSCIEFQIMQGDSKNPKRVIASMYDCQEPTRQVEIEPDKWYRFVVTAKGEKLDFYLDGEHLNSVNLNQWTEAGKNPDGTPNKFKNAYKGMSRRGKVGLQYHKPFVHFRNLTIEEF